MKYIILIVLQLALIPGIVSQMKSQEISFEKRIVLRNETYPDDPNGRFENLVFGINTNATNGLDSEFGEFEIPNHPPSGLSAFFFVPKEGGGELPSYVDIRGIPEDSTKYFVRYTMDVQRGAQGKLYMGWTKLPIDLIDSAYIVDIFTEDIVRIDMMATDEAVVENENINRFYIYVWYSFKETSVVDNVDELPEEVAYPNPFSSEIKVNLPHDAIGYSIYNSTGRLVTKNSRYGGGEETINIESEPTGFYMLSVLMKDGGYKKYKIIKY